MIINGRTMGNYIGELPPASPRHSTTAKCPDCGGPMHAHAEQCRACRAKTVRREQIESHRDAAYRDRKRRYDLALAVGWPVEDLAQWTRDHDEQPPSDQEILKRYPGAFIREWWNKEAR